MEFLAPHLLWALPLVGIPLLLYWYNRQQAPEKPYPSLAWLDEQLRKTFQQEKKRRWAQVLWRILLLLLLIYTLSQPVLGEPNQTESDQLFVFVDNSMSMEAERGGQSLLEASRAKIQELIADDSINSLAVGRLLPTPSLLNPSGRKNNIDTQAIQTQPGTASGCDLLQWTHEADLPEQARIIVITDGQRSFFDLRSEPFSGIQSIELWIPFQPDPNHTLLRAHFQSDPIFQGQSVELTWKTRPAELTPQYIRVAGDTVYPENNQSYTWKARNPVQTPVIVELPQDSLDWDNRWYTAGNVREQLKIYPLGLTPSVESIIHLLGDQARVVNSPDQADLVLVGTAPGKTANVPENANLFNGLPRVVVVGNEADRRWMAEIDAEFQIPWQFEGMIRMNQDRSPALPPDSSLPDRYRELATIGGKLRVNSYYETRTSADETVLLQVNGQAVLAKSGNWILSALPPGQFLDPERASVDWPPFISRVLRSQAQQDAPEPILVGEPFPHPLDFQYPLQITGPEDEEFQLESSESRWTPAKTGFYEIRGSDGSQKLVGFNHNPAEGNLRRLDPEDWPGGFIPYQQIDDHLWHLKLTPWLWILLLGGIAFDSWLGQRSGSI